MSRATILVVEDDRNLMQGIREILELQEYRVLTANNGLDGLEIMQSHKTPPDLIVSDIMMPGMNGYEFFEAVRNEVRWTAIPFIFLTAKGEKSDVRAGKSMGADDYVTKPFDAEDLLVAVDAKLRRRKELDLISNSHITDVKRSILTILNHEFRTPLTYVVAYADMLNRDADDLTHEEIKSFLRGVNSGADRLRRLVDNFILLVELETGEAQRTFTWRKHRLADVGSVISQAVALAASSAADRGIRVQVEPLPRRVPPIMADNEYLAAALYRVIDNAIKFTDKPDRPVTITVSVQNRMVCISVKDQGRGIPPDEITSVFEMFYQIDRDTYEDQGAGAGLPIVKRIVEMHGGLIDVFSKPGEGSEFVIRIPAINN